MREANSEGGGKVPKDSEGFGTVRNDAVSFGNVQKISERKENHTLTVREVARMFEEAGVARTERSIINWCQPGKLGVPRLDCYFDPNEHKYFITGQSVELAVNEEQAKARHGTVQAASEGGSEIPKSGGTGFSHEAEAPEEVKALRQEIMDLKITNRAKDYFVEQLQKDREGFVKEREQYVRQLIDSNRRVGELETQLRQLAAP